MMPPWSSSRRSVVACIQCPPPPRRQSPFPSNLCRERRLDDLAEIRQFACAQGQHVVERDNAHEYVVLVDDRQAANLVLGHQLRGVEDALILSNRDRRLPMRSVFLP